MSATQENEKIGIPFLDKIFFESETNRYGIISILLIAVGCLGGVGVYTGGLQNTVELVLLVASTMLSLSMILAVAPMKAIVYSSLGSIILSTAIIIFNIFVL